MKINKIKINSYGKLKDKEIDLKDGINLIYGKNESGKSTVLKFIINSFYGISKNKKGKEYSDFEKYTPWVGEEFSGKLEYELNNKNKYEIYRDFKKKNPQIFNENKEDISKKFNINKLKGNEFFYEQTKVDEELFLSTVVVGQQEVKLEKQEQSMLIQKIANLVGTGEDNISYKRAIERINKRQLDEIGTKRSREKPINITEKKIEELENQKKELNKYESSKYEIEENINKLEKEITELQNQSGFLKEIKLITENEKLEKEKIKIKENIKDENTDKINIIKNKIEEIKNNNKDLLELNYEKIKNEISELNNKKIKNDKLNKKENKIIISFFILIVLINILQFVFIKNNALNYIFILTVPVFLAITILYKKIKNNKIKNIKNIDTQINTLNNIEKINMEINNLKNEINLIEKNNIELEEEIIKSKNNLNLKINLEKEKIKNRYINKIEKNKINSFSNIENINFQIENLQNEINNKKIELHTLNFEQKNIEPKLENLSKIEEELINDKERMLTLEKMNLSFELAKEILTKAYEKMKNTVTPRFTQELSANISKVTNGKYTNVRFNDEVGLIVELENGNYVPASRLSIGTIDQLYLSLRLSMVEELSEETMPIILDEVFAFYDTERLENILKYINDKFDNHQVILFTRTKREEEILNNKNINYNLINL